MPARAFGGEGTASGGQRGIAPLETLRICFANGNDAGGRHERMQSRQKHPKVPSGVAAGGDEYVYIDARTKEVQGMESMDFPVDVYGAGDYNDGLAAGRALGGGRAAGYVC